MKDIIFSVKEKIEKARSIALTAHISEDADALGSVFALNETLKNMGKDTTVFLSGALGGNMTFFDEKYETEIPADPKFDLMICLDCGDIGRIAGREAVFENASETINIDHHFTNTNFADVNWVEGEISSTAEMLCSLIPLLSGFNRKSASYLYAGIFGDTGGFKYKNVTPDTMRTAAELLRYNIDHADIVNELFDMQTIGEVRLRAEIMQNIQSYFDSRVNIVAASDELFEKYGLNENDIGGLVEIPRKIKGTEIAASMKITPEKIKLSIRSGGKANAASIAEIFGGGGHKMAAGASSSDDIEKTTARFLEGCRKELERIQGE